MYSGTCHSGRHSGHISGCHSGHISACHSGHISISVGPDVFGHYAIIKELLILTNLLCMGLFFRKNAAASAAAANVSAGVYGALGQVTP